MNIVPEFCPACGAQLEDSLIIGNNTYLRCDRCGSAFLDPHYMIDKDAERARYLCHHNGLDNSGYRVYLETYIAETFALIGEDCRSIRKVFDYGSGPTPSLVTLLREKGYDARGWDPYFDPEGQAFSGGADLVTCLEVVEHFRDVGEGFQRLAATVRTGGWCAIGTHTVQRDRQFFTDTFPHWWYRRDPTHVSFYTREGLESVARRFGLTSAGSAGSRLFLFRRESIEERCD